MIEYRDNEQLIIEIKKLIMEKRMTQKQVADILGMTPQNLTCLMSKKNFAFSDAQKIAGALGLSLFFKFDESV